MRISFRSPISVKDFMNERNHDRTVHRNVPAYMQNVTQKEMVLVNELAHEVLLRQQQGITIGLINIIALIMFYYETKSYVPIIGELERAVEYWCYILTSLGASVSKESIKEALEIHKKMFMIDKNGAVILITKDFDLMTKSGKTNLKGIYIIYYFIIIVYKLISIIFLRT